MWDFLDSYQVTEFKRTHSLYRSNQKKSERIKAILFFNRGYSHEEIAETLSVDDTTEVWWHKIFSKKGMKALLKVNYKGDRSKLNADHFSKLSLCLEKNLFIGQRGVCLC